MLFWTVLFLFFSSSSFLCAALEL